MTKLRQQATLWQALRDFIDDTRDEDEEDLLPADDVKAAEEIVKRIGRLMVRNEQLDEDLYEREMHDDIRATTEALMHEGGCRQAVTWH